MQNGQKSRDKVVDRYVGKLNWRQSLCYQGLRLGECQGWNGLAWGGSSADDQWKSVNDSNKECQECHCSLMLSHDIALYNHIT